jgi:hypothetical protein
MLRSVNPTIKAKEPFMQRIFMVDSKLTPLVLTLSFLSETGRDLYTKIIIAEKSARLGIKENKKSSLIRLMYLSWEKCTSSLMNPSPPANDTQDTKQVTLGKRKRIILIKPTKSTIIKTVSIKYRKTPLKFMLKYNIISTYISKLKRIKKKNNNQKKSQ